MGFGFGPPGLSTNLTSIGIGYNQKSGFSDGGFGANFGNNGLSFSPSIGYSHSFGSGRNAKLVPNFLASDGCPVYEGKTMETFTIERPRLEPYIGPSRWRGAGNWASTTLSAIAFDASTFEPTDLAWQKWAARGVIGAAAITSSAFSGEPFPKPWYTDRPKDYIPNPPKGFDPKRFDRGIPPNNVAKWALIGAGTYKLYKTYRKSISNQTIHKPALMDKTYVAHHLNHIEDLK